MGGLPSSSSEATDTESDVQAAPCRQQGVGLLRRECFACRLHQSLATLPRIAAVPNSPLHHSTLPVYCSPP